MTEMSEMDPEFRKCATCAGTSGSPSLLCDACRHNQALIGQFADVLTARAGIYDTCARAFGTTRDVAKQRLMAACSGAKQRALTEPQLLGWTWKAHLDHLHEDVRENRWLRASQALAMMLCHALDKVRETEICA